MDLWCKILLLTVHIISLFINLSATILILKYIKHKQAGHQTLMDRVKTHYLITLSTHGTIFCLLPIGLICHEYMEYFVIQSISLLLSYSLLLLLFNVLLFVVVRHLVIFHHVINFHYENLTFACIHLCIWLTSLGFTAIEFVFQRRPNWMQKLVTEQNDAMQFSEASFSSFTLLTVIFCMGFFHLFRIEVENVKFQDTQGCCWNINKFWTSLKSACSRQAQLDADEETTEIFAEFRRKLLLILCSLSWLLSITLVSKSFLPLVLSMLDFVHLAGVPLYWFQTNANLRCYSCREIKKYLKFYWWATAAFFKDKRQSAQSLMRRTSCLLVSMSCVSIND